MSGSDGKNPVTLHAYDKAFARRRRLAIMASTEMAVLAGIASAHVPTPHGWVGALVRVVGFVVGVGLFLGANAAANMQPRKKITIEDVTDFDQVIAAARVLYPDPPKDRP